ncbi:hypothetical protein BDR26DRAFT_1003693 [Obelidium mucronatum]|nr:hypothetical protein BDR26DRAFT_1003693 [Obelidium mucronatum]
MAAPQQRVLVHPSLVVTTPEVPGHDLVQTLGVVRGFRGERPQQTIMGFPMPRQLDQNQFRNECYEDHEVAFREMSAQAGARGANAIVGMLYDGVFCYGTAAIETNFFLETPMAQQQRRLIDPSFIVGSAIIEGYEIVQCLGIVIGTGQQDFGRRDPFDLSQMKEQFALMRNTPLMSMSEALEYGNKVVNDHFVKFNDEAFNVMSQEAAARGANAIVGVEYDSRSPEHVSVYGTAVIVQQRRQ